MKIKKFFENNILYIDSKERIEFDKGFLVSINKDKKIERINIKQNKFSKLLSKSSIMERLLRLQPRYVTKLEENIFLCSDNGGLWIIDFVKKEQWLVFKYLPGTNNPLHFVEYCRNGKKEIVFGDYGGKDTDGNIGVYRYADFKVERIACFNGSKIDHIHRVDYDKYRDCYWIFTGDSDSASGIWRLEYGSGVIEEYLKGSQQLRSCVCFILENKIIYATDSPIEKNYIYSIDIKDKKINQICGIPGTCIYGHRQVIDGEEIYFLATAVEPDTKLDKIRYRLTYKLGEGIQDRYVHLLAGNQNEFKEVWKTKKDNWPMWLFQFGNIRFATQKIDDRVVFYTQSCREKGTYMIKLGDDKYEK